MSATTASPEPESDMPPGGPGGDDSDGASFTPAERARGTADAIDRAASVAVTGVVAVGLLRALAGLMTAGGAVPRGPLLASALVTLATAVLAGWLAGGLLHGLAAVVRVLADQAEVTGRMEQRLVSGLDALAVALESARLAAAEPPVGDRKSQRLVEIRHAIRTAAWADAEALVRDFAGDHPDDPDAARLAAELAEDRQAAAQELLARVEAAREANDPERVIELRGGLRPLLAADALHAVDRDLARWFLTLIHRRLRAGTVRADVAVLAGRVAEALDDTPEGASLRASLPTLRRAAGLCARCGQPYAGIENACPACLTGPGTAVTTPPFVPAPEPVTGDDDPGD